MCRIISVGGSAHNRLGFNGFDTPRVVVPGNRIPVIGEDDERFLAKWGFPHYTNNLVFNARAESVYACIRHGSGFWRDVLLGYVPISGFKEGGRWFALEDSKDPEPVFSLAVYDLNRSRVALVTTVAYQPVRQFHERQLYVTLSPKFPSKFEDFFDQPLAPLSVVAGW